MLLLHQVGTLKIGEVIRYTLTYTPSQDRILPSPERLYVRIRNTSAIALRAAFVHGPYTLSAAAYPADFAPNDKFADPHGYGVPEFEPMVKAGGSWECELVVPEAIRQTAGTGHGQFGKSSEHDGESASWIIEVSSQVMFSASAAVSYEVVVGRDQKSLNLNQSTPVSGGGSQVPRPGKLSDHQQSTGAKDGTHPGQPRGIFSRAVHLKVEDTATLWNTPRLPGWDDAGEKRAEETHSADKPVESVVNTGDPETKEDKPVRKQKGVHLVILTHGLHSNLGADMLYMKESIDAAAKQAKVDAKARREKERAEASEGSSSPIPADDDDDDDEVVVRGFSGNATKTERGIKYLGKRLARYVLSVTFPDQPYIPIGKGAGEGLIEGMGNEDLIKEHQLKKAHKNSTVAEDESEEASKTPKRPFKITSISFIGHSLGGLVQTYAVAYIQKHSPQFFDVIKPINFIAMASPFLGLSNENPLYIKFALDFGLVGRTGKDLGLTWRAPTIARNGWGALVGNLGESAHKKVYGESQPESKPLLRILPTGPAHMALRKFRNRTTYSNVVNDGIVPLRTSCLLFLDWSGLGRVEKARREAGLVETMFGFGWAELTGTNMASSRQKQLLNSDDNSGSGATTPRGDSQQVPQPDDDTIEEDDRASLRSVPTPYAEEQPETRGTTNEPSTQGPLSGFFNLFRSNEPPKPQEVTNKQRKILRRGQTRNLAEESSTPESSTSDISKTTKATSGHTEGESGGVSAPPTTTLFEAAGDLLNPKMPDVDFLIDPSKRPRTIFHDRVYHPSDIPPPPLKKRPTSSSRRKTFKSTNTQMSSGSGTSSPYPGINHEDSMKSTKDYDDTANTNPDKDPDEVVDGSNMRVEEKIARGYHRDLAWRKVLVKLEPDAHNNIIVRRMFANAYGWPVIKHLVDVHFSDSATSRMKTEDDHLGERAMDMNQPPDEHGKETNTMASDDKQPPTSTEATTGQDSDRKEARDKVPDLPKGSSDGEVVRHSPLHESMTWSERDWADSENDTDVETSGDNKEVKKTPETNKSGDKGQLSPSSWKWTEKIVGRGATAAREKSPAAEVRVNKAKED
jgi:hypothetical protein